MLKSKNIKRLIGWAVFILFCGVTLLLIIKASLPTPDKYGTDYQGITFGGYKNDITQNIVTAEGDTTVLESEELCLMLAPDTTVKILQKSTGTKRHCLPRRRKVLLRKVPICSHRSYASIKMIV